MEKIVEIINKCSCCDKFCSYNKYFTKDQKLAIWQYGENFHNNAYQILFVGKVVRKDKDDTFDTNYINNLWNGSYPFWSYTKNIVEEKLNLNFKDIAITNLIKCDCTDYKIDKSSLDKTPHKIKENCLIKKCFFF